MADLQAELRAILVETGGLALDFDGDADLYSDLGLASIKAMELLQTLEEKFGVAVPDDEFVEATTLNKLGVLMARLVAERP